MTEIIPCRVINLLSRPERLVHMAGEFSRLDIAFEPFAAVDVANDPANVLAASLVPRRDGRDWLNSEIGCLLSHYELWRQIAGGDADYVAIFEDDVVLSDEIVAILRGDFPADADIVKLDTHRQVLYLSRKLVPMAGQKVGFRRLLSDAEGSPAYVISRSAARKMAGALKHFDFPIDNVLFSPRLAHKFGLNVYQSVPAVVIQGMFVDDLKASATMASNRIAESSRQGDGQQSLNLPILLLRMVRRVWRQLNGRREIVPFAASGRAR